MHHPVLDIREVSYTYGDGVVLRDVDLTVREGGFYGIVGPSGGGQTTLLRLMEGSLKPGSGTVDRRPHARPAPREGGLGGVGGPAGAGKTTLLRLMEGSLRPGSGTVDRRPDGRTEPRLG